MTKMANNNCSIRYCTDLNSVVRLEIVLQQKFHAVFTAKTRVITAKAVVIIFPAHPSLKAVPFGFLK